MKLYSLNGQFYTYDYLHNVLGYNTVQSFEMSYSSANEETWGQNAGTGYYSYDDQQNVVYFVNGKVGWVTGLNDLAWEHECYPSDAETVLLRKDDVISESAYYDQKYLIRRDLIRGWINEEDLPDSGWEIYDDTKPAYYILTSTTEVQGPPLGETHLVLSRSARGSRGLVIAQSSAAMVLDVYVPPIVVTLTAQCSYVSNAEARTFVELDGSAINQYGGSRWDAPVMYNGELLKASRIVDQPQFQFISTSGRPLYRYSMSNIPSGGVPYYCFADSDGYLVLTGGGAIDYALTINNITITQ